MDCQQIDTGLHDIIALAEEARASLRDGDTGECFVRAVEEIGRTAALVLEQADELRRLPTE